MATDLYRIDHQAFGEWVGFMVPGESAEAHVPEWMVQVERSALTCDDCGGHDFILTVPTVEHREVSDG